MGVMPSRASAAAGSLVVTPGLQRNEFSRVPATDWYPSQRALSWRQRLATSDPLLSFAAQT